MSGELSCFKAYDIRGRIPDELNEDLAYRIGRAYAAFLQPRRVAVGHDVRLTSPALSAALAKGLLDGGAEVWDIGLCGTEEIYFATFHYRLDGGIMVTASHNPMDYNGMKLVREQAKPISGDSGLFAIRDLAADAEFAVANRRYQLLRRESKNAYVHHLLSYLEGAALQPLKIVVNAGNGGAGSIIDALEPHLPSACCSSSPLLENLAWSPSQAGCLGQWRGPHPRVQSSTVRCPFIWERSYCCVSARSWTNPSS